MVLTKKKIASALLLLVVLLMVTGALALSIGSTRIPFMQVVSLVLGRFFPHQPLPSDVAVILFGLRLPRIYLAMLVGMSLAVAGAGFQALLRNPLADPHVLGVSSGAALAAILSIAFSRFIPLPLPIAAFIGGLITIFLVYSLGSRSGKTSPHTLILAGIIAASFFSSIIIFLEPFMSGHQLREATFWLMGDFSGVHVPYLKWVAIAALASVFLIYRLAGSLNVMLIGDREATHLGVNVEWVRRGVFVLSALLTGLAVSVSGSIGFVGLIVPHLVRLLFGNDYRLLIPASALVGAMLTVTADLIARSVAAPIELPVGAITALAGAPVFIYLLRRDRVEQ
ncbi:MAG: iron ABC transporter permease [Acidobacteriia bacterium]|nr:iron ABC transporter permease [Terriglobia bacterium]